MYIGEKKIVGIKDTDETTPGNVGIVEVQYKDGSIERLSNLMYEVSISKRACDASELREKRIVKVVAETLQLLRDWGVKVGELSYFSSVLNNSLNINTEKATRKLWTRYMPEPQ